MSADPLDPAALPGQGRIIVAFSGGPDSVCLLHQLARGECTREILCVHVDHGLDPESGERARRAGAIAADMGIDCQIASVEVDAGRGPEAAARAARYRALESLVGEDDALATAHHADDQTETVLLRLIRGAGPEGLAGIRRIRPFGRGWLVRPLLDWDRSQIEDWLQRHRLDCIRDPANDCPDFDRNHLRHSVLPALRERWPGVDGALRRSARLCRGAADFVTEHVDRDLSVADGAGSAALFLGKLSDDSAFYRGAAIRAWCLRRGVEPPPGRRLDAFLDQVARAAADRCPEIRWSRSRLRFWDDRLWLEPAEAPADDWELDWDGLAPLTLPSGLGTLSLEGPPGPPLDLTVRAGRDGESLRPANDTHSRDCKRLLAQAGVPPWQRPLWPRIRLGDDLVALGARWLTGEFARRLDERGQRLRWTPGARPLVGPHAGLG
jgi:tRNA(Ile)-lysidine synthase